MTRWIDYPYETQFTINMYSASYSIFSFRECDFEKVNFRECSFSRFLIRDSDFGIVNFEIIIFEKVISRFWIRESEFGNVNVRECNFRECEFEKVIFEKVNFVNVNFENVIFENVIHNRELTIPGMRYWMKARLWSKFDSYIVSQVSVF